MKFPTRQEYQERLLASMPKELRARAEKDFSQERKFEAVKLEGGKTLKLSFMDFIGDWWLGTTSHDVAAALKEAGDIDHIVAEINSYGGFAHEGVGIYNLLRSHPAKVTTNVIGVAYSAASVIHAAGDERLMGTGTTLMIHNALTCACGNAAELRETADYLDTVSSGIADIYVELTGMKASEVQKMLDSETYMSVKDCLEKGFATKKSSSGSAGAENLGSGAQLEFPRQIHSLPAVAMATHGRPAANQKKESKMSADNDAFEKAVQAKVDAETKAKNLETELASARKDLEAKEAELSKAKKAQADLDTVLKAAGAETADAAVGTIATALEARDKLLPEAQKQLEEIAKANEDTEATSLLDKLKAENRISPAQEKELWPSLSLDGKKMFAKTASPINSGKKLAENENAGSGGSDLKWNDKTYNELSWSERATLKNENPELYEQMRPAD